jgi:hypothetical protein
MHSTNSQIGSKNFRSEKLISSEENKPSVCYKKYDPLVVNGPMGVCLLYSAGHFRGQATGGFARLVFFLQPIL